MNLYKLSIILFLLIINPNFTFTLSDSLRFDAICNVNDDSLKIDIRIVNRSNEDYYFPVSSWYWRYQVGTPEEASDVLVGVNEIFIFKPEYSVTYPQKNRIAGFLDSLPFFYHIIPKDSVTLSFIANITRCSRVDSLIGNKLFINLNIITKDQFKKMVNKKSLNINKILVKSKKYILNDVGLYKSSNDCFEYKYYKHTKYIPIYKNAEFTDFLNKKISIETIIRK